MFLLLIIKSNMFMVSSTKKKTKKKRPAEKTNNINRLKKLKKWLVIQMFGGHWCSSPLPPLWSTTKVNPVLQHVYNGFTKQPVSFYLFILRFPFLVRSLSSLHTYKELFFSYALHKFPIFSSLQLSSTP